MRSKNCLTSSMLEPGSRHSARLVFTSEQVRQYCAISGDHNAIHRELAAAQLRFPGGAGCGCAWRPGSNHGNRTLRLRVSGRRLHGSIVCTGAFSQTRVSG